MEYEDLDSTNFTFNDLDIIENTFHKDGKIIIDGILVADLDFQYIIYTWYVPFLFFILGIACIGNIIILSSSFFIQKPISIYLKLCLSLANSDLWAAILIAIGLYVNSYLPSVIGKPIPSLCFNLRLEVVRISGMFTSVLHLLALSVGQFLGIICPFKHKRYATSRRVNCTIICMYIFPVFIMSFIFYFFIDDEPLRPCTHSSYSQLPFRTLIFLLFTIPLIITFILYFIILYILLNKREGNLNRYGGSMVNRSKIQNKLNIVKITFTILTTFTFSWGICVLYFFLVCKKGCLIIYLVSIDFYTAFACNSFVNTMVVLKLALNPLIYAFRIDKIRDGIMKMFCTVGCCGIILYICKLKKFFNSGSGIINIDSTRGYQKNDNLLSIQEDNIIDEKFSIQMVEEIIPMGNENSNQLIGRKKRTPDGRMTIVHAEINDCYMINKDIKNISVTTV
uniref:G_PROTEIN_RECEP_F1_2 domain-containing protein n=1 Tax=Strongyloides venezuelensis TaxID=75913 RepID=A0A0K0EVI9_STRVS